MRVGYLKVLEGQNSSTRTIAQTIPHPIHVMFGWAACHSKTLYECSSGILRMLDYLAGRAKPN